MMFEKSLFGQCVGEVPIYEIGIGMWEAGYRQISNRFCRLSRVNVSEDELCKLLPQLKNCKSRSITESDRDYYRRTYSEDTLEEVGPSLMQLLRRFERENKYLVY